MCVQLHGGFGKKTSSRPIHGRIARRFSRARCAVLRTANTTAVPGIHGIIFPKVKLRVRLSPKRACSFMVVSGKELVQAIP